MCGSVRSELYETASRRSHDLWMHSCENKEQSERGHDAAERQLPYLRRLYGRVRAAAKCMAFGSRAARIAKNAFVAAATTALVVYLLSTHGESGTTLGEIVAAYGRTNNVHVTALYPDTGEITYELWISRELNFLAMIRGREHIVYDLAARQKRWIDLSSEMMECGPLSELEYAGVRRMADRCPSPMLTDVPSDARWVRASGHGTQEVYELTQTDRTGSGRDYAVKYEVVIDRLTRLPQRFSLFRSWPPEAAWECVSQIEFEYPAEAQMESLVEHSLRVGADGSR